jgi:hypothetical protein
MSQVEINATVKCADCGTVTVAPTNGGHFRCAGCKVQMVLVIPYRLTVLHGE